MLKIEDYTISEIINKNPIWLTICVLDKNNESRHMSIFLFIKLIQVHRSLNTTYFDPLTFENKQMSISIVSFISLNNWLDFQFLYIIRIFDLFSNKIMFNFCLRSWCFAQPTSTSTRTVCFSTVEDGSG